MPIFGFTEAAAAVAWGVFTFYQFSSMTNVRSEYERDRPRWAPPGWVFPLVWTLLYAALSVGIFYFTQVCAPDSWQLIVGVVAYIFNIVCNKMWSYLFWDLRRRTAAMNVLIFCMLPSCAALIVASSVGQQSDGLYLVPLIVFAVYTAWLVYALVLNIYWATKK